MDKIELIKKFLRNECSREEQILVDRILIENPDLVDEQLSAKEWDKAETLSLKSVQLKDEIWAGVYAATRPRKKILQLWKPLSIAASLVLVFGLIYFYLPSADKSREHNTSTQSELKTASNKTTGYLKLSMPDGSIITLSPGAVISYPDNFSSNRKIFLKTGKAAFEVAKDKAHPFTVWAKNIATTALGTKFTVAELKSGVDVKLYEGKVVVDAFDQKSRKRSDFLKPGERYTASLDKKTQRLSTFSEDFDGAIDKRLGIISNLVPGAMDKGMSIVNTPLSEVFKQMELAYQIKITYNQSEVENKYFTGSFSGRETPLEILNIIASINEITVHKQGQEYRIQSQKEKGR